MDRDHFSNFSFPHPKEAPYEIWAKLAQRFQRRSCLKMLTDGRTDGRTDARTHGRTDGRRTKSDHNSSSWAELRWANKEQKIISIITLSGTMNSHKVLFLFSYFIALNKVLFFQPKGNDIFFCIFTKTYVVVLIRGTSPWRFKWVPTMYVFVEN